MFREPYYFTTHLEGGAVGRAWLNDLPVHKTLVGGPDSMHGGANHMLVPGKNRLSLEILALPPPGSIPPVGFKLYRVKEPNAYPIVANMLLEVTIPAPHDPQAAAVVRPDRAVRLVPELPLYHEIDFDLPTEVAEGPFLRSPVIETTCAGTTELKEAVKELQDALEALDLDRFLDLISLKHAWFSEAFAGDPNAAPDKLREGAVELFARSPAVRPLDFSRLHFESRRGGRVVYVSTWDGGPVLEAVAPPAGEDQPTMALRTNLLLTRHDGRIRVFG